MMWCRYLLCGLGLALSTMFPVALVCAQDLLRAQDDASFEAELSGASPATLAARAEAYGSAARGAFLFYRSAAACVQCHSDAQSPAPLGPQITEIGEDVTREAIIESILHPSRKIDDRYRTLNILTLDGTVLTGIQREANAQHVVLSSATNLGEQIEIARQDIEARTYADTSMMPTGLAGALGSSQAFFDVVEYVYAVARGGVETAEALRPKQTDLVLADDTAKLDHAGIIRGLNADDLAAGRAIYFGHCVNCHGEDGNQPKLVTARAFGRQPLKFGSDPLAMLRTLTFGKGLMGPMRHLSPKQRYQVIHFIRESLMKDRNPTYRPVTAEYLAGLPQGTENGEATMSGDRDFGPVLASQFGRAVQNGLSFRLAKDLSFHFDLHRFRSAGTWIDGFLDLSETQHYRQRGERMPQRQGIPLTGLEAYAWELAPGFEIPEASKPPRGPVDTTLAEFHGHYLHGNQAILSYRIHDREVLEAVDGARIGSAPVVRHTFRIGPGRHPLRLRVIKQTREGEPRLRTVDGRPAVLEDGAAIAIVPTRRAAEIAGAAHANEPLHVVDREQARNLDMGTPGHTVLVRFRTSQAGTLLASTPPTGRWQPNGKSLFIRGGRLVFDIGWVGALTSRTDVSDDRWHLAALVVTEDATRMYVDGNLEAQREGFRRPPEPEHVLKVGATADNFGGDFRGQIAWATILDRAVADHEIRRFASLETLPEENPLWVWMPEETPSVSDGPATEVPQPRFAAAAIAGNRDGLRWQVEQDGSVILTIPAAERPRVFELSRGSLPENMLGRLNKYVKVRLSERPLDPATMTHGGPTRWPEVLEVQGELGEPINGYALDSIPVPFENPWNAWLRTSAVDFFCDGRAVVTTHGGDVYLVDGIDAQLDRVSWKRYAAGLFEPFGVRVVDGVIYVTCRDGIKRLHDFDGNGEADFVEAFWNDDDVSNMFHAYNFDLQTDSLGNFYYAKAGQYSQHHRPGAIMKVPPEGGAAEVVAFGLRTPNGMGKLKDDRLTVSDNQGPWMPAGKISLVRQDAFLGSMPINEAQDAWLRERFDGQLPERFDEPFIWMPQELDNSCGGQLWVDDPRFGPLTGRLLHSSFGKGWLYHLSLQELHGQLQASIIALPHQWDAGVMRIRVNPRDGQVYGTGLSGWQGPAAGKDGCLQRLRYTGAPVRMIDRVGVVPGGVELAFSFGLPAAAASNEAWQVSMWDYQWSQQYGSDQYSVRTPGTVGRDTLQIDAVEISPSGKTATLKLPQLIPCDQLRIEVALPGRDGEMFKRDVYMTVHRLP